jgi:hypothetical protein
MAVDSEAVKAEVRHPAPAKLRASGSPINPQPAISIDFDTVQLFLENRTRIRDCKSKFNWTAES